MLEFDRGAISKKDWNALKKLIDEEEVKSVIEFGAGISSKLFYENVDEFVSFEHSRKWIDKVKEECPNINIIMWDNWHFKVEYLNKRFDLAFIDGMKPRDNQVIIAKLIADRIVLHDGYRKPEKKIIEDLLSDYKEIEMNGSCRGFRL